MARLAYLGTPELAVPPLAALQAAGHEIVIVISRPDARRGRGSDLSPSPVKRYALEYDLKTSDDLAALDECDVDLAVVVAYGRLIPKELLDKIPMINLHFSLLPRWRGAAPVERAILAGDSVTGVCVMAVAEELDSGDIYAQRDVPVGEGTLSEVRDRLVDLGSTLLVECLATDRLPTPVPQSGEVTYAKKITAADLELNFSRSAQELARVVRLEGAFSYLGSKRLRIHEARVVASPGGQPGDLVGLTVATGDGGLELISVQPEGKRRLAASEWRRGLHSGDSVRLGRSEDL